MVVKVYEPINDLCNLLVQIGIFEDIYSCVLKFNYGLYFLLQGMIWFAFLRSDLKFGNIFVLWSEKTKCFSVLCDYESSHFTRNFLNTVGGLFEVSLCFISPVVDHMKASLDLCFHVFPLPVFAEVHDHMIRVKDSDIGKALSHVTSLLYGTAPQSKNTVSTKYKT